MLGKLNLRHNLHNDTKISDLIGMEDRLCDSDFFNASEFDFFGIPSENIRDLYKFPLLVLASDSFFDKMDNTWYPICHDYNEDFRSDEIFFIGKILQCKSDLRPLIDSIINEKFKIKVETSAVHSDDISIEDIGENYRISYIEGQYKYQIHEVLYQKLLNQFDLSFTTQKELKFNRILNVHYLNYGQKINLGLYPINATNENIKILTGTDFNFKITNDMVKQYNLRLYVLSAQQ